MSSVSVFLSLLSYPTKFVAFVLQDWTINHLRSVITCIVVRYHRSGNPALMTIIMTEIMGSRRLSFQHFIILMYFVTVKVHKTRRHFEKSNPPYIVLSYYYGRYIYLKYNLLHTIRKLYTGIRCVLHARITTYQVCISLSFFLVQNWTYNLFS